MAEDKSNGIVQGLWLRKATKRELRLEYWFDELRTEVKLPSVAILVEGRKDIAALGEFDIEALSPGRNLNETAEELRKKGVKTVILLPDTDRAGQKLLRAWKLVLQRVGLNSIDRYWKTLLSLKISHVEGIVAHIRKSSKIYNTSNQEL